MHYSSREDIMREAVGVFHDIEDVNQAVAELEGTAFPRHDISVLAGDSKQESEYSSSKFETPLVEDRADAPRAILVRPEEKTILTAAFTGGGLYAGIITALAFFNALESWALYGTMALGGLLGAVLGGFAAWCLNRYYNDSLKSQIDRGGIVLWVRTPGPKRERIACEIMRKHGGDRVHVHEVS